MPKKKSTQRAASAPTPTPAGPPGDASDLDPAIIGLFANVYCAREPSPIEAFLERWERFTGEWGSRLRWYQDVVAAVRPRPFKADFAAVPRARIATLPPERLKAWKAHAGTKDERLELPTLQATLGKLELAYLRQGMETSALASPRDMLAWFEAFVRGLPLLHATFGLGLADDWCLHDNQLVRRALLCRFVGLDYDTGDLVYEPNGATYLRPPNWLTLLHPTFVERLGGRPAFQALERLGLGIELHDWPEGILIQAGPRPLLGDVNAGESVEPYRAVSRLLRPLRAPGPFSWINVRPDSEADEWHARFD